VTRLRAALRRATRETVQQAFEDLGPYLSTGQWISQTNVYRHDTINALERDSQPGSTLNHVDLGQYIAAAGPCHCVDGWSYLGRALDSHVRGDRNSARHLGYYAELRAAMALLATEGIGIFDRRHFVVEASGACSDFSVGAGTHEIAWQALQSWARSEDSADLLEQVFLPGGIPIGEWLDEFRMGSSITAIGSDWLESWGLDLQRMGEDRAARNQASYRPMCLQPTNVMSIADSLDFAHSLWAMCAPSAQSRFEVDRYLLRLSLTQAFAGTRGTVTNNPIGFTTRISRMLGRLLSGPPYLSEWNNFLTFNSSPQNPLLISEAWATDDFHSPRHHIQVLARAALLLRVATGACERLLRAAGYSREDLEFWWKPLGETHGLWEPGIEPDELTDLWAEVRDAMSETRSWEAGSTVPIVSSATYLREQAYTTSVLGQCERVALWGLGI
jgi:hypothetical protein